ncbi:MAG: hypothetical protein JO198_10435 [Candidatus Dormibacteraeota bacterium]|nr:hypothetical protein [Candidatus Dormibacteraeota bacterium]
MGSGRSRLALAATLSTAGLLAGALSAVAAPNPSTVTVGVADADPTQATVNGGPISGQGDNGLGQPLTPCPPGACESFTINLTAPSGYTTGHVIKLAVSVATTTPVPPNPQAGTIDTYLEDKGGNVLSSDAGSHNPSLTAVADAAPGTFTLVVAGSTGAQNNYTATVTASSSTRATGGLPSDISFAPSTVVSPMIVGGEPQVTLEHPQSNTVSGAIDNNRGFIDWPLSSRTNIGTLWRTTNGGDSFRQLYDLTCAQRQRPNCLTGGGGDTVNRVNFSNGHVLFGDQESLAAEAFAQSQDHGDSFPAGTQQAVTASGTGVDRQWIAPVSAPGFSAAIGGYALDGIFSYHVPGAGLYVSGIDTSGLVHPAIATQIIGVDQSGSSVVDTTGGPGNGWLYLGYRNSGGITPCNPVCGNLVATVPVTQFETPSTSPTSQWHVLQVNPDIPTIFPWITLDKHGNAYAAWNANGNIYMAYSLIDDRHNNPSLGGVPGTLWSSKVQVNPSVLGSTIFPEIVAGDPGHVAITYVGTADYKGVTDNATPTTRWYTFASITGNAFDPAPAFLTGQVSHRVAHVGTICTAGTTCIASSGDRSLLDMIDLSYDASGRIGVVYGNNNNSFGRQEVSQGSQGSPYIMFAKLANGPSLFTSQGTFSSSYPSQCRTSPAGDATWPNHITGASNIPALDILGDCLYDDGHGNLVARIDLADASSLGMQNALTAYNKVTTTDIPAQRVQYVVRFETANDVEYMAFENANGTESAYGGVVNSSNAITNGSSAVGTLYNGQTGFTVTATRSGNSLFLSAPLAQFGVADGDTLTSVTAFSNAGPAATSLGVTTLQDGSTIVNIDRVVDASPPMDVVVAGLLSTATPEAPSLLLLPALGAALAAAGVVRMRRRGRASSD